MVTEQFDLVSHGEDIASAVMSESRATLRPTASDTIVGEQRRTSAEIFSQVASLLSAKKDIGRSRERDGYSISELSKHLGVSLRTLRFYEQSGFVKPERKGIRRVYSKNDRDRLTIIVTFREIEVSLVAIRSLFAKLERASGLAVAIPLVEGLFVASLSANLDRINELTQENKNIERTIEKLNGGVLGS